MAFPADLSDRGRHAELVADIGSIDVAVINGYVGQAAIRPILDIDVDSMRAVLDGAVLSPLSLVRLLLPGMVDRGDGALLFGLGGSAKKPLPQLAGAGSAQASLRNYLFNLNIALQDKGVYVGALAIGALIERSDAQRVFDSDVQACRGFNPERVDPDDLADLYWDLHTKRDRVEETVGALAA